MTPANPAPAAPTIPSAAAPARTAAPLRRACAAPQHSPSSAEVRSWSAALTTGVAIRVDPRALAAPLPTTPQQDADALEPASLLTADPFALSTRQLGDYGETLTARLLHLCGWRVVERNVRLPGGELDLIAQDAATLVFVEVKTRRCTLTGAPQAAVTPAKANRLRRLAGEHLVRSDRWHEDVRIDVAALCILPGGIVEIEHLRSAV